MEHNVKCTQLTIQAGIGNATKAMADDFKGKDDYPRTLAELLERMSIKKKKEGTEMADHKPPNTVPPPKKEGNEPTPEPKTNTVPPPPKGN